MRTNAIPTWGLGLTVTLALAPCASVVAIGCGSTSDNPPGPPPNGQAGSAGDAGSGPSLNVVAAGGGGGFFLNTPGAGGSSAGNTLTIGPANLPPFDITGPNDPKGTQQLQAQTPDGKAVHANWTVDNPLVGTIDSNGVFKASGQVAGTTTVHAQAGSGQGSIAITVRLHLQDNPGNIPGPLMAQLQQGGQNDSTFAWLYPYDRTVFPRGLTPPTLQWDGVAPNAFYLHITAPNFDYQGFYAGSSPARLALPDALWNSITLSADPKAPVQVQITKISGGKVTGPSTQNWFIAPGTLKGTVYYGSYTSALAHGPGLLRITPGQDAKVVSTGCTGCHSISADGSTLTVSPGDYGRSASYDLRAEPMKPLFRDNKNNTSFELAALYPDGSRLLSHATFPGKWTHMGSDGKRDNPNLDGFAGWNGTEAMPGVDSKLYNTKTGQVIPAPGFDGVIKKALMPMFSPDGKQLAFTHYDTGMGHSIALMDFDATTNKFANLRDVVSTSNPTDFLGWPSFTPDGKSLVISDINNFQFTDPGILEITDIASKQTTPLDALNGIANGKSYLPPDTTPYPPEHANVKPTVLPIAAGGYVWVVFTSYRRYGNIWDGTTCNAAKGCEYQKKQKLWVAAIDLHPTPGTDPSHPAFYLSGQELNAGNLRGFWVLSPCQQNGVSCASGDECCTGFCRQTSQASSSVSTLQCVPPPQSCSQESEKCTKTADCCGAASTNACTDGTCCINGFCSQPAPKRTPLR